MSLLLGVTEHIWLRHARFASRISGLAGARRSAGLSPLNCIQDALPMPTVVCPSRFGSAEPRSVRPSFLLQRLTQSLGSGRTCHQHRELLSCEAGKIAPVRSGRFFNALCNRDQHLIASRTSQGVVEPLEVVNVDSQESQRHATASLGPSGSGKATVWGVELERSALCRNFNVPFPT